MQKYTVCKKEGDIPTGHPNINKLIREYYEWFYDNKFWNLDKIDKFIKWYNLPKIT